MAGTIVSGHRRRTQVKEDAMEAGYVWDSPGARTEGAVAGKASLTVVARPEVDGGPDRDLAGGIVRFGLNSSKKGLDADCAGGIVRFGFGPDGQ
jgi:hypothetical protein